VKGDHADRCASFDQAADLGLADGAGANYQAGAAFEFHEHGKQSHFASLRLPLTNLSG
jgi:hypothetical protein